MRLREGKSASVVNPRNDLGETSCKEERAGERKRGEEKKRMG